MYGILLGWYYLKCHIDSFRILVLINNKQLLNEVEQDMRNYYGLGLCYLPQPLREPNSIIVSVYFSSKIFSLNACFASKKTQAANNNGTA